MKNNQSEANFYFGPEMDHFLVRFCPKLSSKASNNFKKHLDYRVFHVALTDFWALFCMSVHVRGWVVKNGQNIVHVVIE